MKAAWYLRNGAARDVLEIGEISTPRPGPGEVLVQVHASGVNPSDVKARAGWPMQRQRIVPHSDGAGIIVEVGAGVEPSRIGERVWIWNGQWKRAMGTAAEYIALPQQQAARLPEAVSFDVGACLGIPLLTALHAIRCAGELQGRTVLVTGGGGVVGHYITQLAVRTGAKVIATAGSPARKAHAFNAGADHVIDYRNEALADAIHGLTSGQGADAVIDLDASGTAAQLSQGILRPHGTYVCYGSNARITLPVDTRTLLWNSLNVRFFLVYDLLPPEREAVVSQACDLLEEGFLRHTIGKVFGLDEIVSAHESVEGGACVGKVVIQVAAVSQNC